MNEEASVGKRPSAYPDEKVSVVGSNTGRRSI